jgi:hypothetical protein
LSECSACLHTCIHNTVHNILKLRVKHECDVKKNKAEKNITFETFLEDANAGLFDAPVCRSRYTTSATTSRAAAPPPAAAGVIIPVVDDSLELASAPLPRLQRGAGPLHAPVARHVTAAVPLTT